MLTEVDSGIYDGRHIGVFAVPEGKTGVELVKSLLKPWINTTVTPSYKEVIHMSADDPKDNPRFRGMPQDVNAPVSRDLLKTAVEELGGKTPVPRQRCFTQSVRGAQWCQHHNLDLGSGL